MDRKYYNLVSHYEDCLDKYGDTHLGVDWPKIEDVPKRYRTMLEVIRDRSEKISLLDFGCGASHLYEFILQNKMNYIEYSGLDLSQKFIDLSKQKYPNNKYYCLDILNEHENLPVFDYIILNGVFTEKRDLTFEEMNTFFQSMIIRIFQFARIGIAFNVMSKQVDWEREDLFHLPLDLLSEFLTKKISRHFIIRNDYGLYEYTAYVYKSAAS